jgi:hypothetical protein
LLQNFHTRRALSSTVINTHQEPAGFKPSLQPFWSPLIFPFLFAVEELYGTRYQSGSFSLTNVGSGFYCLHSFSFVFKVFHHIKISCFDGLHATECCFGYHAKFESRPSGSYQTRLSHWLSFHELRANHLADESPNRTQGLIIKPVMSEWKKNKSFLGYYILLRLKKKKVTSSTEHT